MELLEREQYLSDLTVRLEAAVGGSGGIALVSGEAGIGKTSLLQEFSHRQKSARVLWGACDALFTPRPLAPLQDIARQVKGNLLAVLDSGAPRERVFTATLDELERGPASLIVFEDVHWADEATLDLLKFIGRRISRTRALLAATYRDDEVGARHPLRFVLGDFPRGSVARLSLSPLSQPAVERLAREAGRPSQELFGITGGNPLFVTEALAGAADRIPVTVRDAVLARAARLSAAAREIAELVSVVPGKAELALLETDGRLDEAGIESCLSIGMVRGEDGSLAFRHEIARRAFEDSLSPGRQQALHARVLAVLAQRPGSAPARLAHHANGAGSAAAVLRFAPLAGEQAAQIGAHREAAAHFRMALRHAQTLAPVERALLNEKYSYECYLTDQLAASIEARRAAHAIWRAAGERLREGDSLRWLSRLTWFGGGRADSERYAAEAVSVLETLPPGPELAMAYSNHSQLDMLAHETDSAISWARRTIELVEPLARPDILSHALNNLGTARLIGGDAGGWEDLERSLEIALEGNFQEHAARSYTNLSWQAAGMYLLDRATGYLENGIGYCDEHDLDSWRLYMLALSSRVQFERCDWNRASAEADTVLRDPRTAPISRITALTTVGHMRVRLGDPDPRSPLEEARLLCANIGEIQRIAPVVCALAESAWLLGDHAAITHEVQSLYERARQQREPWVRGTLAVWLHRAGALTESPAELAAPFSLEISGRWAEAARTWESMGVPYEQATVLAHYGEENDQREALAVFERLGASPAAQALRKRMREQGIQSIPRGSRSSTRQDPHGLTRREAQILGLLCQGLRNSTIAKKLFLSTKTVDHHVSAILTKLGVPSRAEAVAMARKLPER